MQNSEKDQVVLNMQSPDLTDPQLPPADKPPPNHNSNPNTAAAAPPSKPSRQPLTTPAVSKPKSRFLELNYPPPLKPELQHLSEIPKRSDDTDSDDQEDEEEEQPISDKFLRESGRRWFGWRAMLEWSAFVPITACLVCSLTLPSLKLHTLWGLKLWKWCLMGLVVLCGRLVSGWLVWTLVFVIERHFILQEKVLYFVYGLRKSVRSCVWLALVLLSWYLVFDPKVDTSPVLHRFSRALVAVLIAATIWLLKILLVKVLASSFHVTTFFDRMKVSVFHHYILETLSGPPLDEDDVDAIRSNKEEENEKKKKKNLMRRSPAAGMMGRSKTIPEARAGSSRRIDIERLRLLSRAGTNARSVRRLVSHIMKTGLSLSTLSRTLDRTVDRFGNTDADSEITSEREARVSAERIFKNVAKPRHKYIEEEDLKRFLTREEVHTIFPLFEGALETGMIKKSAFRNWVVRAYRERKSLAHSLNDTKTAVQQLHKLASAVVSVIIIIVSLLVMGVATTKVLVVVTSQLLVAGFLFQNMGKTIFESIIFVFVMHPFDVGDRCVIDGVQMIVEEMNILTTVFLRYDNEKIYYPNAVLLTKPISNFYRSPDMGDMIEFSIDVSTPVETVAALRKSIQTYLESKPKYWHPKHSVLVKEIENVNKMKMALNVLHTMNHQNFPEKNNRRSELVFELKKIFESLGIKYHLLPQEVHLTQVVMADGRIPAPPPAPTQV
ncbi:mechanosensitive ion channel protein 10 isoform X1 [Elaeis guineensis]|uniref:Mechanosensitive ion channel protein n=1 Tax=Elaeis guineensis var. tenera TaxID=51953 RepID=A0A6I9SCM2_ELAGV|nr:mechanosensitive ion channel protein 10 isoform X1 [Elaeis guineensis]